MAVTNPKKTVSTGTIACGETATWACCWARCNELLAVAELAESGLLATWLLFTAAEREAVRPGATVACEVVARCAVAPLAALLRETAAALAWTVGWAVADGLTRCWETAAWLATPADWVVCRRRCVLLATWEAGAGVSGAWGPATERCTDWLVAAREAVAGASCDGLTGA